MKPIFFFLSVSLFAYAGHLSLDDAIRKTLASHPDAKRFALQVQSARYGTDVIRADRLPQLTLTGEYDPTKTYTLPQNGAFMTKESDGWSANALLTQKLWDFSKTSYAIQSQEVQEEISSLSLNDAKALCKNQVERL